MQTVSSIAAAISTTLSLTGYLALFLSVSLLSAIARVNDSNAE